MKNPEIVINDKTLTFSHKNTFDDGEVHNLFNLDKFLYWVLVIDDVVISITSTLREEAETWEWWDEPFTNQEFDEHTEFCKVLNQSENIEKFQELLGKSK